MVRRFVDQVQSKLKQRQDVGGSSVPPLIPAVMLRRSNAFLRSLNALRVIWDVSARRRESNQTEGGGAHGDDREQGKCRCTERDERTL